MGKIILFCFMVITNFIYGNVLELEKNLVLNQLDGITDRGRYPDYKILLISGTAAIAAYSFDEKISRKAEKYPESGIADNIRDIFNGLGSKEVVILPALGYAAGVVSGNNKMRIVSFISLESLFTASCTTIALKSIIGRARPEMDDGAYTYKTFSNDDIWNSMPSGHSTAAWALFTPIAECYNNKWIYLIPAGVSAARVVSGKHWTSDVIIGGIIGYTTGYALSNKSDSSFEFTGNGVKIKF